MHTRAPCEGELTCRERCRQCSVTYRVGWPRDGLAETGLQFVGDNRGTNRAARDLSKNTRYVKVKTVSLMTHTVHKGLTSYESHGDRLRDDWLQAHMPCPPRRYLSVEIACDYGLALTAMSLMTRAWHRTLIVQQPAERSPSQSTLSSQDPRNKARTPLSRTRLH